MKQIIRAAAVLLTLTLLASACNGHDTQSKDQPCHGPWHFTHGVEPASFSNHGDGAPGKTEVRWYMSDPDNRLSSINSRGTLRLTMVRYHTPTGVTQTSTKIWTKFETEQWHYYQLDDAGGDWKVVESYYTYQYKSTVAPLHAPWLTYGPVEYHDADGSNPTHSVPSCLGRDAHGT